MGLTLSWEEKPQWLIKYTNDNEIGSSQYTARDEEIFLQIRNILEDNKKRSDSELNKMTLDVKCQLEMSLQFRTGYKGTLCHWAEKY